MAIVKSPDPDLFPANGKMPAYVEFDVMKEAQSSLKAAYTHRAIAAETTAEQKWWDALTTAITDYPATLDDTDPDELMDAARFFVAELKRIGGIAAPKKG